MQMMVVVVGSSIPDVVCSLTPVFLFWSPMSWCSGLEMKSVVTHPPPRPGPGG